MSQTGSNIFEQAKELDTKFPSHRDKFHIPTVKTLGVDAASNEEGTYLCGNSLGLMPKATREAIIRDMDAWAGLGVNGHFTRPNGEEGWYTAADAVAPNLAKIVGAKPSEVAISGGLTINLNSLFATFYKPSGERKKIFFEANAFPSDRYAFQNQARLHGYTFEEALIEQSPREGEFTLRIEDILEVIEKQGHEIAIIIFPGIQFYSGQKFDMKRITEAGHAKGCLVGWDLAHAVGNVELEMHDWNVDFAVFCTYKYLNCGAGATGGFFVHEKFHDGRARPAGWFGVDPKERFKMLHDFDPIKGARGWVQSCSDWAGPIAVRESVNLFNEVGGVKALIPRARSLTGFLEQSLKNSPYYGRKDGGLSIITSSDPEQRGTQLSVFFYNSTMPRVFDYLESKAIITDQRKPDVLRISPVALYNTHYDVAKVVTAINEILAQIHGETK